MLDGRPILSRNLKVSDNIQHCLMQEYMIAVATPTPEVESKYSMRLVLHISYCETQLPSAWRQATLHMMGCTVLDSRKLNLHMTWCANDPLIMRDHSRFTKSISIADILKDS